MSYNCHGGNGGANTGGGGGGSKQPCNTHLTNQLAKGGSGIVVIRIATQDLLPIDVPDGSVFTTTDTNKEYVLYNNAWSEL